MSNFKIVMATRANNIYKYKNTKNKILNYNANISLPKYTVVLIVFYLLF